MEDTNTRVRRLIGDALEGVRSGLAPLVELHLSTAMGPKWRHGARIRYMRRRPKYDASLADITGDVGVLLTVVLQEWEVLGKHLYGCRHWIDMARVLRNVWAHASELELPVAAAAYTAAYELAVRGGLPVVRHLKARRDEVLAEIASAPHATAVLTVSDTARGDGREARLSAVV